MSLWTPGGWVSLPPSLPIWEDRRTIVASGVSEPFAPANNAWSVGGSVVSLTGAGAQIAFAVETSTDGLDFSAGPPPPFTRFAGASQVPPSVVTAAGTWGLVFNGVAPGIVSARLLWTVSGTGVVAVVSAVTTYPGSFGG